jgi:uncharacterized protein YjiS (DUF1127 family)
MGSIIAMQHDMAGQSWAARLIVALKYWWTSYLTWRLEQAVVNQLCSMSDRELKDIGLDRSEIVAAVRGNAADSRHLSPLPLSGLEREGARS